MQTAKQTNATPSSKFKQGQQGTYAGFRAVIVRHYEGNMWEIRVPGGVTCVDCTHFLPA